MHNLLIHVKEVGGGRSRTVFCLGIESTAHTFSCSVVSFDVKREKGEILSNVKSVYDPPEGSGIHPREASRYHIEQAAKVLRQSLRVSGVRVNDVDAIAYSAGPGLGPCLRVGAVVARSLSSFFVKPLVPVNHAVGHVELGAFLGGAKDPVVLLISGGHTLISAFSGKRWRVFGETLDLTIGQLLDQFGREIGYSSPAGHVVEKLAERSTRFLHLPYSVKGNDVSYSGILTAAKKLVREGKPPEDMAFSIQEVAFAMLCEVYERAIAFSEKKEALVVGGVAANKRLCKMLEELASRHGVDMQVVPAEYSGDCGAQIAWTGLLGFRSGIHIPVEKSVVRQSWRIDEVDAPWRS